MNVFNTYQWDLNYTNPAVFIRDGQSHTVSRQLRSRCTQARRNPFLVEADRNDFQNEPEAHLILQTMKACALVVAPGTVFKSEAIVQPVEIIRYLGDGLHQGMRYRLQRIPHGLPMGRARYPKYTTA